MAVVTGTGQLSVGFNQVVSTGLVSSQTIPASISKSTQYTNGTATGTVDLCYAKALTLAGSATTLDLTSLTDLSGATVSFARIRELYIENTTTTTDFTLTIGNAAATAWAALLGATGTLVVHPGDHFYYREPTIAAASKGLVTSGSSKSLKLDPGANTIIINIMIVGCSAAT